MTYKNYKIEKISNRHYTLNRDMKIIAVAMSIEPLLQKLHQEEEESKEYCFNIDGDKIVRNRVAAKKA